MAPHDRLVRPLSFRRCPPVGTTLKLWALLLCINNIEKWTNWLLSLTISVSYIVGLKSYPKKRKPTALKVVPIGGVCCYACSITSVYIAAQEVCLSNSSKMIRVFLYRSLSLSDPPFILFLCTSSSSRHTLGANGALPTAKKQSSSRAPVSCIHASASYRHASHLKQKWTKKNIIIMFFIILIIIIFIVQTRTCIVASFACAYRVPRLQRKSMRPGFT